MGNLADLTTEDKFQSTLPTRGSDKMLREMIQQAVDISIHAPHEGERPHRARGLVFAKIISIHAPHEGERR